MIDNEGIGARPRESAMFAGPEVARRRLMAALAGAALLSASVGADIAHAQSADCQQLRSEIAAAGQGASRQSSAYDSAALKQRAEIDKTIAYSRQIGCDRQKFFIFGSDPPPQCGGIYAQIARMQANLGQLQSRGSGGGARADLIARYQSECANPQPRPGGFFAALFSGRSRDDQAPPPPGLTEVPLVPDPNAHPQAPGDEGTNPTGVEAHAGSKEVCVRTCDGYFFPISYSGSGGHSGDLAEMCRALCPNAEVALYSYSPAGDISQAVGADGARYADLPNALKYRKSVDSSCTCRQRGQSWAQALADAETLLGARKNDIIVTPEKSEEMSRLRVDPKAKPVKATADPVKAMADPVKGGATDTKTLPAAPAAPVSQEPSPTDLLLGQQPATMSRETSGIASGDVTSGPAYSKGQGQTEEVTGPDGVKRRVRIIDPTL
jgi:hypothetical protein